MLSIKNHLPKFFYHRFFWQFILAALMLGMAAFFVRHEHVELLQIREQFSQTNPFYLLLGLLLTVGYIFLQGEMYVQSFKALHKRVPLTTATVLFLKRNFVSVFLPAGGFSSLAFFTRNVEKEGVTRSQIHLASTIYALCGILSVVVVAVPVLYYALLRNQLQTAELLGFGFLLLLTVFLLVSLRSLLQKGWAFRLLQRYSPAMSVVLEEMAAQSLSKKHFFYTLLTSVLIEAVGVAHLYIAMLALGYAPSLPAALIGYVVMVILLIASPFLRGLGAIEVSLTFVLGQYGLPVAAAASVTLLFRLFEFWIPLFAGIASFFTRRDNLLLRLLPALLILILGLTNIVSAITPALPARLRLVQALLPDDLIPVTNGLVLVSGLVLTLISVFLLHGSRRAWYLALLLTGLSAVGHLVKAADYEEAILALTAAFLLGYTRSYYTLKPHPRFTRLSLQVVLYGLAAVLVYGVVGFYFMDRRHFGRDFELWGSVRTVFNLFFLLNDAGIEARTTFGRNFLYSFYGAGGTYLLFVVYGLLRPYFSKPLNTAEEQTEAKILVEKYGHSPLDFFKTYPDKLFFFSADGQAFISFKVTRHLAVVLEDPVASNAEAMVGVVREFDGYCRENGFVAVYYRVPEASLPLYRSLGKKSLPIGEEAVVDLKAFTIEGGKMKPTRSAINRLSGEGFVFKVYPAPVKEGLLQKLELVSEQWLEDMGQKEIAFTQGIFDRGLLKTHTICTIEDAEERVHAFLDLLPDYAPGETTYDLIRKISDAPNGVLDMLLTKTFLHLKEQGYQKVNMGLAPMSGIEGVNLTERTIKYAYENIRLFGHFKGLRRYKEKFFPQWEQRYLIYEHNYHLLQVPAALRKVSEAR